MKLCCPYCLAAGAPWEAQPGLLQESLPFAADRPRSLTAGQLGLERVADRRRRGRLRRRRGAVLLNFLAFDLLGGCAVAQTDAARLRADLDDLEIVLLARLERPGALQRTGAGAVHGRMALVAALAFFDLRVVAESFDVIAEFDESAEGGDARDFALHDLADFMLLEPLAPDVVDLFDAEGDATIIRIDLKNLGGDGFALLENFMWILDALGPAYVADVHEAVEAFFDFNESAELRDVADFSGDDGAHRIFIRD